MSRSRREGRLSPRRQRFCQEYAAGASGAQAAVRAGYAKSGADVQAVRLLANPSILAELDRLLAESAAKAQLTIERTDRELSYIAFCDPRRLFRENGTIKPPSEWDAALAAAVASFEVIRRGNGARVTRVRFWDKPAALALAARRLGLLRGAIKLNATLSLEQLVAASFAPRNDETK